MIITSTTPPSLPPPRPLLRVLVRCADTRKVIAGRHFSGLMGPTYVAKWVQRQAISVGLRPGEFEFQIGKGQLWAK